MRIAIVEDDLNQQENIERIINERVGEAKIVGKADSVTKALELLGRNEIDLAILDVMIKGGTTFDVLEKLGEVNFQIVFTTSYDNFAIKAFKQSAIDYLLKPFGEEEFMEAIDKVKSRLKQLLAKEHFDILFSSYKSENRVDHKIAFPDQSSYVFIHPRDIIRCESDNNYTKVITKNKSLFVSRTLKAVEEMLEGKGFYRVHNRALVNLERIESISRSG